MMRIHSSAHASRTVPRCLFDTGGHLFDLCGNLVYEQVSFLHGGKAGTGGAWEGRKNGCARFVRNVPHRVLSDLGVAIPSCCLSTALQNRRLSARIPIWCSSAGTSCPECLTTLSQSISRLMHWASRMCAPEDASACDAKLPPPAIFLLALVQQRATLPLASR